MIETLAKIQVLTYTDKVKILILGGGGMIGQKLIQRLAQNPYIQGRKLSQATLVDAYIEPKIPTGTSFNFRSVIADITDFKLCQNLIVDKPEIIFHLAAVVSGEAEADFEKGYRVNLDGTRNLFEAIRKQEDYFPRVVYTSTGAVYGGPYPDDVDDDFILQPSTSYGTQKAIGELLLNDYSRRGFLDGIGLRLPTICVRPGKPNAAASGVFSNIIREPLVGIETTLTVSKDVSMIFASPKSAVGFLIHAAGLDTSNLGTQRSMIMPGVHATIGEELDALQRVAGEKVLSYITEKPDVFAQKMVEAWNFPPFPATRARSLGFTCEETFDQLIQEHIESELDGEIPGQR
jgi:nucleoside-diphosphate-sugar epimerase